MNNFSTLLSNNAITGYNSSFCEPMSTPTDLSIKYQVGPRDDGGDCHDIKKEFVIGSANSPSTGSDTGAKLLQAATTPRPNTVKCHMKSGNKKSFVWKYFNHPKNADGVEDRTRTECLQCKSQLAFNASGTTTTMLNHLKSRHPKIAENEEWKRVKVPNSAAKLEKLDNGGGLLAVHNGSNNDSPTDSFLSIDMSTKAANPSPDYKSTEVNFWPLISSKPDALMDQNRYLCLAATSLIPKHLVMTSIGQETGSLLSFPGAHQSVGGGSYMETNGDINNNPRIGLPGLSSPSPTERGEPNAVLNNTSNSSSSTLPALETSPPQLHSCTPTTVGHSTSSIGNSLLLGNAGVGHRTSTKRKRKNISVNKLNLNGNMVQIQKRIKVEPNKNVMLGSNGSGAQECGDLAPIQSINAMSQHSGSSISNILSSNFLSVDQQHQQLGYQSQSTPSRQQLYSTCGSPPASSPGIVSAVPLTCTASIANSNGGVSTPYSISSLASHSKVHSVSPITCADHVVAYWLVKDLQPFSILEESGIKTLFSLLMPSVTIPTSRYLKSQILPSIYSTLRSEISSEICIDLGCAFSIELWDNVLNNCTYASVQLHYYSRTDQTLKCKMLKTKEINAKCLCSNVLLSCCDELGLAGDNSSNTGPLLPLVTNEAASVRDELANVGCLERNSRLAVFPCLVTSLHEVARLGYQQEHVARLIGLCRELREVTRAYDLGLSSSCPGSGGSSGLGSAPGSGSEDHEDSYQLVRWVHSNLHCIDDKLDGFNSHRFSKEDETLLRQLMPLLEHIHQTLDVIEQNKLFLSASMIKSIVLTMTKSPFQPKCNDHPGVIQFKSAVKNRLDQIYPSSGPLHEMLWIATLLDPRFKKYHDFTPEELSMIQTIKHQISPSSLDEALPKTDSCTETPREGSTSASGGSDHSSAKSRDSLQCIFGEDLVSSSVAAGPTCEVDVYLREHKIDIENNPIHWWLDNAARFPQLSRLARRYLCIPLANRHRCGPQPAASNASLGRRRRELLSDDLDTFLFLHHNWL